MSSLPDAFLPAYCRTGLSTSPLAATTGASLILIDYLELSEFTASLRSKFEILFHLPTKLVFNFGDVTRDTVSAVEIKHRPLTRHL